MTLGVAISTTGDEHRLGLLEDCVAAWRTHLPLGAVLVVTVDGQADAVDRVYSTYDSSKFGNVFQVGQVTALPDAMRYRDGRLGVAVSKNTGLDLLMAAGVDDLFLCDDDAWPLLHGAMSQHVRLLDHEIPHSMICWGRGRHPRQYTNYASWSWPRGVLLYAHRSVVETVGGMDERFGPGGHEHVEWSRRIHAAGLTPKQFCTPRIYADDDGMGVQRYWNCADIERTHKSSVRRVGKDWKHINTIMTEREGDTSFVPYSAAENGRESATLWTDKSHTPSAEEPGRA